MGVCRLQAQHNGEDNRGTKHSCLNEYDMAPKKLDANTPTRISIKLLVLNLDLYRLHFPFQGFIKVVSHRFCLLFCKQAVFVIFSAPRCAKNPRSQWFFSLPCVSRNHPSRITSMFPFRNVVASCFRVTKVMTEINFGLIRIDWNSNPVSKFLLHQITIFTV